MKTFTQTFYEARAAQIAVNPNDPGGGQFIYNDKIYTTSLANFVDGQLEGYQPEPVQGIWIREELGAVADQLSALSPALLQEFMDNTPGFFAEDFENNIDLVELERTKTKRDGSYLVDTIKWIYPNHEPVLLEAKKHFYPTLVEFLKTFLGTVHSCAYTVLRSRSHIERQMSIENPHNHMIRIYVPLSIPEGDVFVEVEGVEVSMRDIFAIDSTLMHSEHNLTDQPRLALLIDIDRETVGLPPGKPYDWRRERYMPTFQRGALAPVYHTVER